MFPHIFVLRPDEAKAQKKGAEGEGGILADLGFPHHRPLLIDGLGGDGQRQRNIGAHLAGMEGALKTAPLQCAAIEHRMKVQGVVSGPVVVLVAAIASLVPFPLEAVHGGVGGQPADLLQHGFTHLLAPAFHPAFVHVEGFEQDILLGVHDGQGVLQTLRGMFRGIYMDVHPAG